MSDLPWKLVIFDRPGMQIDEFATEEEAREALDTTYGSRWDLTVNYQE